MKISLILAFCVLIFTSCNKSVEKTETEKKYEAIMAEKKKAEMDAVIKADEEKKKKIELDKLKASRWVHGVNQLQWVSAACDAQIIDKGLSKKVTAIEMDKKIHAWMDLKSDDKPTFGDPKEIPILLAKYGFSKERIPKKHFYIHPSQNPYISEEEKNEILKMDPIENIDSSLENANLSEALKSLDKKSKDDFDNFFKQYNK